MVNLRELAPSASPLDIFGSELRRVRESAELKQASWAAASSVCTGSLIGQIETTKKAPTRDFAERTNAALGTDGVFSRRENVVRVRGAEWIEHAARPATSTWT
ncbi:helix-turn-helix domain-containing protein [Streptomyces sp. NPDC060223]|uniref:helix-turn-helix domain-containing protein n=1 Tax=unclassified Streptomyces TaxID=2593676 RepID=UPI00363E92CB